MWRGVGRGRCCRCLGRVWYVLPRNRPGQGAPRDQHGDDITRQAGALGNRTDGGSGGGERRGEEPGATPDFQHAGRGPDARLLHEQLAAATGAKLRR